MAVALPLRTAGAQPPDAPGASTANVSRIGRKDVICPCCGRNVQALIVSRSNSLGGVDRDLFARSVGPQPVFYRVSTCTHCSYSGYVDDFGEEVRLPPDFAARWQEVLLRKPGPLPGKRIRPGTDQAEIPAVLRYELAADCYRLLQRSDEALAWLCLRASWVIREQSAYLPPDERVARMLDYVRRRLGSGTLHANQADRELVLCTQLAAAIGEGHFNAYQKPYAELVLAFLLRRYGENGAAGRVLDRILKEHEFPDLLAEAARRMLDSIPQEQHWQRRAARHFGRALHMRTIWRENEPVALYLMGELHRRLGDHLRAVEFFDRALEREALPPDLCTWARERRSAALAQN